MITGMKFNAELPSIFFAIRAKLEAELTIRNGLVVWDLNAISANSYKAR